MAENCPYYSAGKCANPNGDHDHDCSWPRPDYDGCSVYILITDPARGMANMLGSGGRTIVGGQAPRDRTEPERKAWWRFGK